MRWFVLAVAVLVLAGCGGGEQAKQEEQPEPIDWPRLISAVEERAKQRIIASGRQPENLHCVRPNDWLSPEGNTTWSCTFKANPRAVWEWRVTVDRDGRLVKSRRFGWFYDLEPEYTPKQKPWAYWTGYTWCREYRDRSLGSPDDVGGDYYRASGESPTLSVQQDGCYDGYSRERPAVPRPKGFRLTGVSPVQDFD
jgi:hypothetical protein